MLGTGPDAPCFARPPTATKPLERGLETARSGARPTDSGVRPGYSKFLSLFRGPKFILSPRDAVVIGSALCSSFLDEFVVNMNEKTAKQGNRDLFPPGDWSVGGHNLARRPRASSVTRAFTPGVAPHVERTCSHRGPRAKRRVRHPSAVYGAPALARQTWVTASTRRMRSSRRLGRARTGRCTRPGTGRRVVWWR